MPILKRWGFYTAQVVGEGEIFSWGGAQTKGGVRECELTKNMFCHSDVLQLFLKKKLRITDFFPDTTVFMIKNSRCELMRNIYRVILTNHIVLYTRLTYAKPYQNILRFFARKYSSNGWSNGPIRLQCMTLYGRTFHP